ncbi:MAG: 2OG-Fe(II) oxygenase family protein [Microcoleaceae cyanobacterium]
MSVIELGQYPIIDEWDGPEADLIEKVGNYLNQFGFFYVKDPMEARVKIDKEMENLQDAVDVYYGEDAYTGEGSVFHGTYSRFEAGENTKVEQYFEFFSCLLRIISRTLGYPQEFLQEFSRQEKYGLYFYDREEEYVESIKNSNREEIVVSPHKDRSLITLVISIKGLEGYTQEYGWFSMPDREGYLIVQGGTFLQKITQNKITANIHRVRGNDSSKALFWSNLVPV